MNAKHTPGKWAAECYGSGGSHDNPIDLYEILADGQTRVCEAVLEENARLIAAAPELLDCLKSAAAIIGHPDDNFSKLMAEVIAKAEGK